MPIAGGRKFASFGECTHNEPPAKPACYISASPQSRQSARALQKRRLNFLAEHRCIPAFKIGNVKSGAEQRMIRTNPTYPKDRTKPDNAIAKNKKSRSLRCGSLSGYAGNRTRVRNGTTPYDYERSCRFDLALSMPNNRLISTPVRGLAISRRRTAYEPLRNVRWHYDG